MKKRIIKFRAWGKEFDTSKPQMHYEGFHIGMEDGRVFSCTQVSGYGQGICGGDIELHEGLVLMQFTGICDKNGKEVYDGDVFDSGQKRGSDKSAILYHVHWDEEDACWGFKQLGGFCLTGGIDKSKIEVVGNEFENPELLSK